MTWELWASFVVIAGAAIVTPGPGNLNTLRRAVELGHRPALFCLFGNVIGLAILGAATTLGLIALLVTTPFLWNAFQWVALGFMVFLALQMMAPSSPPQFGHDSVSTGSHRQLLFEALAVSALNPKAAMFYIAVFPLYTDPAQPFVPQATLIVVTCLVISALSHGIYIFLASVRRNLRIHLQGKVAHTYSPKSDNDPSYDWGVTQGLLRASNNWKAYLCRKPQDRQRNANWSWLHGQLGFII